MKLKTPLLAVSMLIFIVLLCPASVLGLDIEFAPQNPNYTFSEPDESVISRSVTNGNQAGYRPSPLSLEHLKGKNIFITGPSPDKALDAGTYPRRYDLRDVNGSNFVSPVRNQAPYGTCWTFAALSSLESNILKATGEALDLSEWHLAYFGYVDQSASLPGFGDYTTQNLPQLFNLGGDDIKAAAILNRWTGAVLESAAPYDGDYPGGGETQAVRLKDVIFLNKDADTYYPKLNGQNLKYALMNYGVVSIGMRADFNDQSGGDSPYYNSLTHAFYIPEGNPDGYGVGRANHAVAVVGWDDDYPAANFNAANRPSGNGAWIVRNSWSEGWGDDGYFYMSYEDAVADSGFAFTGELTSASDFTGIYQHDPLGWVTSIKLDDTDSPWMANIFYATATEHLTAVSFYAGGVGNVYEIYVGAEIESDPGDRSVMVGPFSGTIQAPGYHTVRLPQSIPLMKDQRFAVMIKLTTPGYNYPIAIESPIPGYSEKASAGQGESFISSDGFNWTDLTDKAPNSNLCIKAFTSKESASGGSSSGGCFIETIQ